MKFTKKAEAEVGSAIAGDEPSQESPKPKSKKDPANFDYESAYRPQPLMVPNYLSHRRAMKASKDKAARILVWGLLVVAIVSLGAFGLRYIASVQQNEAVAEKTAATDELKKYAGFSSFFDGLDLRENKVKDRLTSEVNYAKVVGAINSALPGGATIEALQTRFGQSCAGPNPFEASESIGCVDFTITVTDASQLQTFLARANAEGSGEVNSFIINSSDRAKGSGDITATGTANFTPKVFTFRFGEEPAEDKKSDAAPNSTPTPTVTETTP